MLGLSFDLLREQRLKFFEFRCKELERDNAKLRELNADLSIRLSEVAARNSELAGEVVRLSNRQTPPVPEDTSVTGPQTVDEADRLAVSK